MLNRITGAYCPICSKGKLIAIERVRRNVDGYRCPYCGAHFDAEVRHDWDNQKHYWVGRLRNPAFWTADNTTFAEGILSMAEKVQNRVPDYLGDYTIEAVAFPPAQA